MGTFDSKNKSAYQINPPLCPLPFALNKQGRSHSTTNEKNRPQDMKYEIVVGAASSRD
jgi:hypothetical protein